MDFFIGLWELEVARVTFFLKFWYVPFLVVIVGMVLAAFVADN